MHVCALAVPVCTVAHVCGLQSVCVYLHARGRVKELVPSSRCSSSVPGDI